MPGKRILTPEAKRSNLELYGKRIRRVRKDHGFSVEALAAALGVSRASVTNWESGYAKPDADHLFRMFGIFGVDPNTFFGVSAPGAALTDEERDVLGLFRAMEAEDRLLSLDVMRGIAAAARRRRAARLRSTLREVGTRYRAVSAGEGEDWEDYPETGSLLLYLSPEVARADEVMFVSGDSMEPQFHRGDRVLVEYAQEVRNGDIGIFFVPGRGGVIKQVRPDRLHSLNPAYDDIFPYEDGARVIGRVLKVVTADMVPTEEERREYALAAEAE